jgi:hypothetical protein
MCVTRSVRTRRGLYRCSPAPGWSENWRSVPSAQSTTIQPYQSFNVTAVSR